MAADNAILEALARLEHKVDLCLKLATMITNSGGGAQIHDHPMVGDRKHRCPVCGQTPTYKIDFFKGVVTRSCGCSTGIIPLDINALAPPVTQRKTPYGEPGSNESEDRQDTGGGGRFSGSGGSQGR